MCIIGVDLGGTKIKIYCQTGATVHEEKVFTGSSFSPNEITDIIRRFITKNKLKPKGLALAVPGLVANETVIACDVLPHIINWKPKHSFPEIEHIMVLNDAEAGFIDATKNATPNTTMALIMVGTAIGAALMSNGKKVNGKNGWAGEFGYFPLCIDDKVYRLDEVAGGKQIEQTLKMNGKEIQEHLIKNNQEVVNCVKKSGAYLGIAIAGLLNLINPEKIILSGGTMNYSFYYDAVIQAAEKYAIPAVFKNCVIEISVSGENIVVLGAIEGLQRKITAFDN